MRSFTLIEQLGEIPKLKTPSSKTTVKTARRFLDHYTRNTCSQGTKARTKQCLKSINDIFSSFNSHQLQLGRKQQH